MREFGRSAVAIAHNQLDGIAREARASLKHAEPLAQLDRGQVRTIALQGAGMWLVTRAMYIALTYVAPALGIIPKNPDVTSLFPNQPELASNLSLLQSLLQGQGQLANWVHWDASWYLVMGIHGYDGDTLGAASFFPLYPFAIHIGTLIFGVDQTLTVGLILSSLAALAAFIGLGFLGTLESREEAGGWRLILVVAAYPFAFYLFAPFTEAFFLAFVVFALVFARMGLWWPAAVCAFLAGLTRPTAIALLLPFAWEYGRQHGFWDVERWRAGVTRAMLGFRSIALGVLAVAAVPLAIALFFGFLKLRYGNAFLYEQAQDTIHAHVNLPIWSTAALIFHRFRVAPNGEPWRILFYIDAGSLIVFAILTIIAWRKLPFIYTLYMLTTLYLIASVPVPVEAQVVPSAGRYMLAGIPIFILLSGWMKRKPVLETLLIGGGFFLQAIFVIAYFQGLHIE